MGAWNELLSELLSQGNDAEAGAWLDQKQYETLRRVSELRDGRNVLLYGSGFLQKPQAPPTNIQITSEDINGLMSVLYGMDWSKGLTLILHTPGGLVTAAETIVAYLRSKFSYIEVIIPTMAMSAGTMVSLGSDKILMARAGQLGPIDPQMSIGAGRSFSAMAIVEQFERARQEITANTAAAHVWAPILQSVGPALLVEAENALQYGENMVARWLETYMLAGDPEVKTKAREIASYFNNATEHKNHGRRIDIADAIAQGLVVEPLESNQNLQEAVLTAYHLFTLGVERGLATKMMVTSGGRSWVKNWMDPQGGVQVVQAAPPAPHDRPPVRTPSRADGKRSKRR